MADAQATLEELFGPESDSEKAETEEKEQAENAAAESAEEDAEAGEEAENNAEEGEPEDEVKAEMNKTFGSDEEPELEVEAATQPSQSTAATQPAERKFQSVKPKGPPVTLAVRTVQPMDVGGQMSLLRLPPGLELDPEPFDREKFLAEARARRDRGEPPEPNKIRWRYDEDEHGNRYKQSNVRLVEWKEAGAQGAAGVQLQVGKEWFNVEILDLREKESNHLFVEIAPETWRSVGSFQQRMVVTRTAEDQARIARQLIAKQQKNATQQPKIKRVFNLRDILQQEETKRADKELETQRRKQARKDKFSAKSQVAGHVQFLEDGLDEGEEEYKRVLRTDEEEEEAEKRLLSSKKIPHGKRKDDEEMEVEETDMRSDKESALQALKRKREKMSGAEHEKEPAAAEAAEKKTEEAKRVEEKRPATEEKKAEKERAEQKAGEKEEGEGEGEEQAGADADSGPPKKKQKQDKEAGGEKTEKKDSRKEKKDKDKDKEKKKEKKDKKEKKHKKDKEGNKDKEKEGGEKKHKHKHKHRHKDKDKDGGEKKHRHKDKKDKEKGSERQAEGAAAAAASTPQTAAAPSNKRLRVLDDD